MIALGKEYPPYPVKLFMGVLYGDRSEYENIKEELSMEFGEIDYESGEMDFKWTNYYADELGDEVKRIFISFSPLISPEQIAHIKRVTNRMEGPGRRRINLDPGYISGGKLVLATTKDQAHRIYLGEGIYAEVTLRFRSGRFLPFDYTYPDYRSDEYNAIFIEIRRKYLEELKKPFPPTNRFTTRWNLKKIMESFDGTKALLIWEGKRGIIETLSFLSKARRMVELLGVAFKGGKREAEAFSHIDLVDYVFPFKENLSEIVRFLSPDLVILPEDFSIRGLDFHEGRVIRL